MEGLTITLVWVYLSIYILDEEMTSKKYRAMRQLLAASLVILSLSSCLKQSIADAMLAKQRSGTQGGNSPSVATMTYSVNGNTVTTSVNDPDKQMPASYQLGC